MELIAGPLSIETNFKVSLPHDLFATLILIEASERLEGISEWIARTASALPLELKTETQVLVKALRYCPNTWGHLSIDIPQGHAAHTDFDAFIELLNAKSAKSYQELLLEALKREIVRQSLPAPASDRAADLRQAVTEYNTRRTAKHPDWVERQADPRDVVTIIRDGASFKRRLITLLESFWAQVYCNEFAACLPVMQRSVRAHQQQVYPADFFARFQAITGRAMPDALRQSLAGVQHITFIPSCHVGPYLVFFSTPLTLQVSFNCRTAGSSGKAEDWIVELFPPLRALADETRLQILTLLRNRELYAQEIIEALGISQSAASRHLQLLENTGVLLVRKENTAKYYSINPDKAHELVAAMKQLLNLA